MGDHFLICLFNLKLFSDSSLKKKDCHLSHVKSFNISLDMMTELLTDIFNCCLLSKACHLIQ